LFPIFGHMYFEKPNNTRSHLGQKLLTWTICITHGINLHVPGIDHVNPENTFAENKFGR
jgi:hypothetical protein